MEVRVRLFAIARQRVGGGEVTVELPEGATVAELRAALAASHPALGSVLPSALIAVQARYADDSETIPPGAEAAVIPPVSGGGPRRGRSDATESSRR